MVFASLLPSSKFGSRARAGSGQRPRLTSSRPSPTNTASASTASTSTPTSSAPAAHGHEFILDEVQLPSIPEERPDLRELNNCLAALAVVFPDIQLDVFREMLTSFDCESRLAVVADALVKNRVSWVKGRWRLPDETNNTSALPAAAAATPQTNAKPLQAQGASRRRQGGPVPIKEQFRSAEYREAVRSLALYEFKGLSRSAVTAVLAEHNHSYLEARKTLIEVSSKSWRFTMANLFSRKKAAVPVTAAGAVDSHPLVIWKSSGKGSILPMIRSTGNAELDHELYYELVAPLKVKAKAEQEHKDRVLAVVINMEEAEAADATHECACCFTTATFEEITVCNANGHVLCFRCIQHSIHEAVFGQGWQRSINKELGTLRCPAVDSDECSGCIPADQVHRAMLEEKNGAEVLHRLDQRLAEHGLISSGLPLVRCPFCSYAEVDELYIPSKEQHLRLRAASLLKVAFFCLCLMTVPFLLPLMVLTSIVCLLFTSQQALGDRLRSEFAKALTRHRRRRRGLKFTCQSPSCNKTSCLSCDKAWTDIHVCHESALVALRTQVEQAMSMAIKRVCPRCNTSFVKNAGCNKLTCPCGYKMCYVCRKDIGGTGDGDDVGYRHFCDHFRPEGDPRPCDQCNKCNLWEAENTDAVLQEARDEAERKWLEAEGHGLNGAEKKFLETGISSGLSSSRDRQNGFRVGPELFSKAKWPSLPTVCDAIVESLFV